MKKNILTVALLGLFMFSGMVYAEMFDDLKGISPSQKQQLSNAYFKFKQQNNDLENQISSYQNKLNQLKYDKSKNDTELSLLKSAYERNISVLKTKQDTLKKEIDDKYKSIMTKEQYMDYQAQQIQADNAFQNFLKK